MYISKIQIVGFRNFSNSEVLFNDGINVIIGHNNAGKTNLLRAMALVLDTSFSTKRLDVDDFYKVVELANLKKVPPSVIISLFFSESAGENLNGDDLVTVSNWITRLESPYEARLTYEFFLPEKERGNYEKSLLEVNNLEKAWRIIKRDFIRKYIFKIFCGDPQLQNQADSESLQKFDFQFLNAIRDVERDMFTGKSPALKEVLQFFMDYEIKKDKKKTEEEQTKEIKKRQETFDGKAKPLLEELLLRIHEGENEILDYATQTGASFNNAKPTFEGAITEIELLSALRLIIEHNTGIKIPAATHNGLGYNNLIYMSLLLAKLQTNTDGDYYGSNAKVYPLLVIEEPEAHLHPSMQYKLLKFLRENRKKKVRQVFVTTHSTHITAAVSLDEIVCLHNDNSQLNIGYPGKVFADDEEGKKSKEYVERFLDATKSNILFAQRVILVEGLTEQILMPTIARRVDKSKQLEDHHIEVCAMGGRYFDHFLKLFDSTKPNTIKKRVACITDRDPERKEILGDSYEKCYPFELGIAPEAYEFKDNASSKIAQYSLHPNIRFFSQDIAKGKTLEYDLAFYNPALELLLTESIINRSELLALMKAYKDGKEFAEMPLRDTSENSRIKNGLSSGTCTWDDNEKKRAIIAARYLNSVSKGENALELSTKLEEDLQSNSPAFVVPQYLKDALEWLFQ
ncbi:MAG: AAA family ATPase [Bacteroidota bacterium]|jgi:predicted ATP-dependent endonuclease of OLD family